MYLKISEGLEPFHMFAISDPKVTFFMEVKLFVAVLMHTVVVTGSPCGEDICFTLSTEKQVNIQDEFSDG